MWKDRWTWLTPGGRYFLLTTSAIIARNKNVLSENLPKWILDQISEGGNWMLSRFWKIIVQDLLIILCAWSPMPERWQISLVAIVKKGDRPLAETGSASKSEVPTERPDCSSLYFHMNHLTLPDSDSDHLYSPTPHLWEWDGREGFPDSPQSPWKCCHDLIVFKIMIIVDKMYVMWPNSSQN